MIIDFHTHIFPEKVAERAVSHLEGAARISAHTRGSLEELRAGMARAGIQRAVTLPVATNAESVPSINRYALSQLGDPALIPFGAVHPQYGDYRREMRRLKDAGIKGIKLHPDYQDAFIDDPAMVRILACASELGLIAVVHGGLDLAFPNLIRCTPERVKGILSKTGGGPLVIAHYGGNGCLAEVRAHLMDSGVYIDTSFAHTMPGLREDCAALLRDYPADRILFGTDSPWDCQEEDVAFIRGLDLEPAREDAIFSGNARRLLDV